MCIEFKGNKRITYLSAPNMAIFYEEMIYKEMIYSRVNLASVFHGHLLSTEVGIVVQLTCLTPTSV